MLYSGKMVGDDEKGSERWPLVKVRSFSSFFFSFYYRFTRVDESPTTMTNPLLPSPTCATNNATTTTNPILPSPFEWRPLVSMVFFFFLLLTIYKGRRISYYHNKSPTTIYHPCDEQWVDESPTTTTNLLLPSKVGATRNRLPYIIRKHAQRRAQ